MNWEKEFEKIRTASHVEERRKQRSHVSPAELGRFQDFIDGVNAKKGIHDFLPPKMWYRFSDNSYGIVNNKWDSLHRTQRLFVVTVYQKDWNPPGEGLTPHLMRNADRRNEDRKREAKERQQQRRRGEFLLHLANRLDNLLK